MPMTQREFEAVQAAMEKIITGMRENLEAHRPEAPERRHDWRVTMLVKTKYDKAPKTLDEMRRIVRAAMDASPLICEGLVVEWPNAEE